LPFDSAQSAVVSFLLETFGFYISLVPFASSASNSDQEPSQGGKLLYAGELDGHGRALVVAGNIAGAATLVATADPVAQKQAIRDGVADFLVTSLDEALRILKNEIRKRETVAVCVAAAPDEIEREMQERGVEPDLRRQELMVAAGSFDALQAKATHPELKSALTRVWTSWSVSSAPARWLPKLDLIAVDCLKREDRAARRWLRLAPRYIGRTAQGVRLLLSDQEFAACFVERVQQQMQSGEIGTEVQIQVGSQGMGQQYRLAPEDISKAR
jgi:Urocanase Rossmann-like domain